MSEVTDAESKQKTPEKSRFLAWLIKPNQNVGKLSNKLVLKSNLIDPFEAFKYIRSEIKHEHDLIGTRTTWLVTCQSFLLTCFAISTGALVNLTDKAGSAEAKELREIIRTFQSILVCGGWASAVISMVIIYMAVITVSQWHVVRIRLVRNARELEALLPQRWRGTLGIAEPPKRPLWFSTKSKASKVQEILDCESPEEEFPQSRDWIHGLSLLFPFAIPVFFYLVWTAIAQKLKLSWHILIPDVYSCARMAILVIILAVLVWLFGMNGHLDAGNVLEPVFDKEPDLADESKGNGLK